jgi:hypothetical protein
LGPAELGEERIVVADAFGVGVAEGDDGACRPGRDGLGVEPGALRRGWGQSTGGSDDDDETTTTTTGGDDDDDNGRRRRRLSARGQSRTDRNRRQASRGVEVSEGGDPRQSHLLPTQLESKRRRPTCPQPTMAVRLPTGAAEEGIVCVSLPEESRRSRGRGRRRVRATAGDRPAARARKRGMAGVGVESTRTAG